MDDQQRKAKGGVKVPFPIILHRLLEAAEKTGMDSIISWRPHGHAFQIHSKDRFVSDIIPQHFRYQTQFASFQRQLNLYGFIRLTRKGPDRGAYFHPSFIRRREELCGNVQRSRINGNEVRQSANPETEPDFSDYPTVSPLYLSIRTAELSRPEEAKSDHRDRHEARPRESQHLGYFNYLPGAAFNHMHRQAMPSQILPNSATNPFGDRSAAARRLTPAAAARAIGNADIYRTSTAYSTAAKMAEYSLTPQRARSRKRPHDSSSSSDEGFAKELTPLEAADLAIFLDDVDFDV